MGSSSPEPITPSLTNKQNEVSQSKFNNNNNINKTVQPRNSVYITNNNNNNHNNNNNINGNGNNSNIIKNGDDDEGEFIEVKRPRKFYQLN